MSGFLNFSTIKFTIIADQFRSKSTFFFFFIFLLFLHFFSNSIFNFLPPFIFHVKSFNNVLTFIFSVFNRFKIFYVLTDYRSFV